MCIDQPTKGNNSESYLNKNNQKKQIHHYYGKVRLVDKTCWKKMKDLEENFKDIEEGASNG